MGRKVEDLADKLKRTQTVLTRVDAAIERLEAHQNQGEQLLQRIAREVENAQREAAP